MHPVAVVNVLDACYAVICDSCGKTTWKVGQSFLDAGALAGVPMSVPLLTPFPLGLWWTR